MRRASTHLPEKRGFTILEVLIAVLIIGILSALVVPIYIKRTEEARLQAVGDELQRLADAQEQAAIQMGYYLRAYALDDLGGEGDGIPLCDTDTRDAFVDEEETTPAPYYDNPQRMFIRTSTGLRIDDATEADNIYTKLANNDAVKWQGPYYNIHRDEALDEHVDSSDLPTHLHDTPNDPWGNDYIFLFRYEDGTTGEKRMGVLVEPDGVVEQYAPGSFGSNIPVSDKIDRPAVLSLGPDGLPGDGADPTNTALGEGDDIYRVFGY